jgi:hypothetical protein
MTRYVGFQVAPISDESFAGLVIAVGLLLGAETYGQAYRAVLGKWGTSPANRLPRNIGAIAQFLPDKYLTDHRAIVLEHTAFPYYAAFNSPDRRSVALHRMLVPNNRGAQSALGLLAFPSLENRFLQYCDDCAREQIAHYRRSTWLRSHQLPGAEVCYRHGTVLKQSRVPTEKLGYHWEPICLPDPGYTDSQARNLWCRGDSWDMHLPFRRLAQVSHELLYADEGFAEEIATAARYRNAMGAIARSKSGIDWGAIENQFVARYGDPFAEKFQLDFSCSSRMHWLRRISSDKCSIPHPFSHALVIGCLFNSLRSLTAVPLHCGARGSQTKIPTTKLVIRAQPGVTRDLETQELSSPSETTATYLAISEIHAQRRERLLKILRENPGIKRKQLNKAWIESVLPAKESSRHSDLQSKREAILALIQKMPGITRTGLQKQLGKTYTWLIKRDRDWLESVLPVKQNSSRMRNSRGYTAVNWEARDKEMAEKIGKLSDTSVRQVLRTNGGINFSALSQETGISYRSIKDRKTLPQTRVALTALKKRRTESSSPGELWRNHQDNRAGRG